MIDKRYYVVKEKSTNTITYYEYDKREGYDMSPKKSAKIEDAINVNKVVIINPSLAEKVARKKFDIKFRKLVQLLNVIFESDDETGASYHEGLDELSRIRLELNNKYRKYLEKEEADILEKKLDLLEMELKNRLFYFENNYEHTHEGKLR